MDDKFRYWVTVVIVALVSIGIVWWIVSPFTWVTPFAELYGCLRIFLVLFAINTFAVLRLYNSIVQNTRFSIKLREAIRQFNGAVPVLDRSIKTLSSVIFGLRNSVDVLKKETNANTDEVIKLTEKIKHK